MRRLKMNKKLYAMCGAIVLALAACADGTSVEPNTSYAEGNSLWNPLAGDFSVNTARYAEKLPENLRADGHWFWETRGDDDDGGRSYVEWPVKLGSGVDSLSTVIESCQGICGIARLNRGELNYDPFVGVGFTIARDEMGRPTPVDVSDWGGICITYKCDLSPTLVLVLDDSVSKLLDDGYAFPAVALPKARTGEITRCYSWDKFQLPSWFRGVPAYWSDNVGEKAAQRLVGIMFKMQNTPGEYAFSISYVGMNAEDDSGIEVREEGFQRDGWSPLLKRGTVNDDAEDK